MIPARGWLVVAIWAAFLALLYIAPVRAGERPHLSVTVQQTGDGLRVSASSCEDVRAVVIIVGEAEAEKAARAAGATDRQIAEARKCLSR